MAISLYLHCTPDRAELLLRGWNDPGFNDDWHEDPFFSSPLTLKPASLHRTLRVDFGALTLADFGAVGPAPRLAPLYSMGGSDVAAGRMADVKESNAYLAASVYAVRLPIAFLRANASTAVLL
ncbi:MAG TPA: hypothetical protein VF316_25315 [Polyangiaceae bacterium]